MSGKRYPNPLVVGELVDMDSFYELQKYSATDCGSWVHFEEQSKQAIAGDYFKIKPLIAEFVTTHLCNFSCPTCSRRMLRETWLGEDKTWGKAETELSCGTKHSIDFEGMKAVVDKLSANGVKAIVWGGGEPTLNKDIYKGISYAKQKGMLCSLITNGVNLHETGVSQILSKGLDLIRISLNCVTKEKHSLFHGYSNRDYYEKVLNNIRFIAEYKNSKEIFTDYGISVILDNKNIDEINNLVDTLYNIVKGYKKSPIDFLIIRSVYNYYENYGQIDEATFEEYGKIDLKSAFRKLMDCGVDVVIPKTDSLKGKNDCRLINDSWQCLGYGWCTEVHPSGDIFLCSDTYGNPDYVIGNILEQEFDEIWFGEKRKNVLEKVSKNKCMLNYCPFTGRGHHLNRIFNQIEELRATKYAQIEDWVNLLKDLTERKLPFYL